MPVVSDLFPAPLLAPSTWHSSDSASPLVPCTLLLALLPLRLNKKLGQHHLTRGEVCRPLVEFLRPEGERVLEVGPGGGVLTRELIRAQARVLGLELDPAWAFSTARELSGDGVDFLVGDALEFPWERLAAPTLVAGNLPYNVGTAIVTRVLPHHERIPRAGFLLQLEVARRLVASPGSRDYGQLSVFTQSYSRPRILGKVAPGAFRPPPKVESAFVGFELRAPPLPEDEMGPFLELVRQGFAHKRKTLRNSLCARWDRTAVDELLETAGVGGKARGEELGLREWIGLYGVAKARPELGIG